jgi:hypothetical protein
MPILEAVPLSLPLKLGSSGRLVWLPFCPDDGRVGPSYFLRVANKEVFVGQRGMAGIHVTFHKDGVAHITAPDHATAGAWGFPGSAKTPSEWSSLGQFRPGWSRLLHVVHPETELRHFNEADLEGVANLIALPVDAGRALHVCLLLYKGALLDTRIEFDNAVHLATFEDGPDWVLEVMAVLEPWTRELRDWADEKRDIAPGSHERSAVKPDFNPASPAARLTKLITMEDGGKWICDLAGYDDSGISP